MSNTVGSSRDGSPRSDDRALELLACTGMPALVCALEEASLTVAELRHLLPGLARSTLRSQLEQLERNGALLVEDGRCLLSERGHELAEVACAVVEWECGGRDGGERAGATAVKLVASPAVRALKLALADGPLRPEELVPRLPGVKHGTLMGELDLLVGAGVVVRREITRRHVQYELTRAGRLLALPAVLAARWDWSWARAGGVADIAGLVRAIAPLAAVPAEIEGVAHLQVDGVPSAQAPDAFVAVSAGSVVALPSAPPEEPVVRAHAGPAAWCDALAGGASRGIAIEGDSAFLGDLLDALSGALRGEERYARLPLC